MRIKIVYKGALDMVLLGDCLCELRKMDDNCVDLIYLDPPFFTQRKQTAKTRDNSKEYSFDDTWEDMDSYIYYIQERLDQCHQILKKTGSIFLHCDRSASHYLRIALDNVFGYENFQSEIIWVYRRWSNSKKGLLNSHQVLYFYSKTNDFKFNTVFENYSPTTNLDQIFQKRVRDENGKTAYKKDALGNYDLIKEKKGVPMSDVWEIPYLNPKAKERVGYPTQKPIILLERIIQLVTDENDVVLDPFCGSGTTLIAAKLLNRKFIGIDISEDAIEITKKRLEEPVRSDSLLLKNGKEAYLNQDDQVLELLDRLKAVPVQRNKGIDGFIAMNGSIKPIPVRIQRKDESFETARNMLLLACRKNRFKTKILVKTNEQVEGNLFASSEHADEGLMILDEIDFLDYSYITDRLNVENLSNNQQN